MGPIPLLWIGPYSVVDSVPISLCEKGLPLEVLSVHVIKELEQQQQEKSTNT